MKRRSFLATGGQTVAFVLGNRLMKSYPLFEQQQRLQATPEVEDRVARIIQAYDAQGNHRTGTEVDKSSAEWLASEVRQLGLKPVLEPFTLSRVDPQSCHVRVGDRRLDGVPLFDAGFTDTEGVRGKLGEGPDAEIRLIVTGPFPLARPGAEHRGAVSEARRGAHKAVILIAGGPRPGLFLINALGFNNPSGPPMLQIANTEV